MLWLVELWIEGSVGDSVRAVGHQQHCELKLSYTLSWEQRHRKGAVNKKVKAVKEKKKKGNMKGSVNTHPLSRVAHWRVVAIHAWHTPPLPDGLWPHPRTPWWKKMVVLRKCLSQTHWDVFKLLHLSNKDTKTQRLFIYHHKWQRNTVNPLRWNQQMFDIFSWKITQKSLKLIDFIPDSRQLISNPGEAWITQDTMK